MLSSQGLRSFLLNMGVSYSLQHDIENQSEVHHMDQKLKRLILFHLKRYWSLENEVSFDQRLKAPQFAIHLGGPLGVWHPKKRIISIQEELLMSSSWLEVIEVLRHESAHQFVDEALKVRGESAHGTTFKQVCEERGIDPRGVATPALSTKAKKLLEKINKLLALAESDNPNEAENAARQAHALLIKHHLHQDELGALNEHFTFRQLGDPKGRHYQYEYSIVNILSEYFFVDCIWITVFDVKKKKDLKVAEMCGRSEDLEIAEYVYHFLHNHVALGWRRYQKETSRRGLKERLSFSLGMVLGFMEQFSAQRAEVGGTQLISLKDHGATEYLRKRHPAIRTRSSSGWRPSSDYHSGVDQGRALRLRKGVHDHADSSLMKRVGVD